MKIYFLSSTPCALFVNGLYFGITDKFARHAEITLSDNVYLRFCPENAQPNGFFLTENIRFQSPAGVRVYLLKDAIALYCENFPPSDYTLQMHAQKRQGDMLATLFSQGNLYLSLQIGKDTFISALPPAFAHAKLNFYQELVFLETEKALAVYTQKCEKLFEEEILSYRLENNLLHVRLPLFDMHARVAECTYLLGKSSCEKQQVIIEEKPSDFSLKNVAYSFFESLLIGAHYEDMLSDELLNKKEDLRAFLGDFEGVIMTEEENTCGLIKQKGERLYEVQYYKILTEKGKITEIEG